MINESTYSRGYRVRNSWYIIIREYHRTETIEIFQIVNLIRFSEERDEHRTYTFMELNDNESTEIPANKKERKEKKHFVQFRAKDSIFSQVPLKHLPLSWKF